MEVENLLADCLRDARGNSLGTVPVGRDGPAYATARRTFLTAGALCMKEKEPTVPEPMR